AVTLALLSRGADWQILRDYQYLRIDSFLNPDLDPLGAGYHAIQSKIALGSGGIHGRGFLNGTQGQLRFLPEQHTDFIFTILAEEFGLIWSLLIVVIYIVMLIICILIALHSKDRFQSLLAIGIAGIFFLYFSVNLAMVTGLAPVVGAPLPLISYGGSSAIMQLFAFGIVLAISAGNSQPTHDL
ncbi:MAG: FtsW/RodA/SpoVE family cell cycle protein, partial [Rhodobacteraceae bacterium]|nr:FtsW/RodA/SpoVE family cell cycle protein [Paracoccaceae bacterium]